MEVEEGRGRQDRGEKPTLCGGPAPEDLKRRSSVFSFPPFFTFTSHSLLIFSPLPLVGSLIITAIQKQADLSAVRQEICPEALRWAAKYRGWILREQKTPKKHIRKTGTLAKCV